MVSDLAIEDIERIVAEGGTVSPRDVVRLNALALRITDDPDCEIATLPRLASVGGVQFRQPCVAKDIILDECYRIYGRDDATILAYEAYILSHDVDDDALKHPIVFAGKVAFWAKIALRGVTPDHLRRVVDYCLYGVDQATGEAPVMVLDERSDTGRDRIGGEFSWALHNYLSAVSVGIDGVAALRATSPQLSAMIERAYAVRGLPLKEDEKKATADYYRTLDEVRRSAFGKRDQDGR